MNNYGVQGELWPKWLRCTLIASAALVLSACQGPSLDLNSAQLVSPTANAPQPNTTAKVADASSALPSRMAPTAQAPSRSLMLADAASEIGFKSASTANWQLTDATSLAETMPSAGSRAARQASLIEVAHVPAELPTPLPAPAAPLAADDSCATCNRGSTCDCQQPLRGPIDEYLCDGGDFGLPVGVRANDMLDGLEQEDTVAHFETHDGTTRVQPSNRVCIYAPRYGVVRRVVNPMGHLHLDVIDSIDLQESLVVANKQQHPELAGERHAPQMHVRRRDPSRLRGRQQAGAFERLRRVAGVEHSLAPYADLFVMRAGIMVNHEKPRLAQAIESAIRWTGDQGPQVLVDNRQARGMFSERQAGIVFRLDEPEKSCLRLIKLVSRHDALPGETIEFTLRFDNLGSRAVSHVAIVDNLSTRLEYVPESAHSSLEAEFSTAENGAGSLVLRWELAESLPPGRGGILQFRCRVR